MDETGILEEGEIYCSMYNDRAVDIIQGKLVITRCPALHPGDVQYVMGVDVPRSSPLKDLHNVVVFSSKGDRDLPSKLSGGDLDGDLYNIIWDKSIYPKFLSPPADYHNPNAINIGRPVERSDITNFFILFMKDDALGRIAILHQILADQAPMGTFDQTCLQVAELHSTAVDFSKTGIPVDHSKIPRYPRCRPDFQATGPRILVNKLIKFDEEDDYLESPEENHELEEVASYSPPKTVFYESPKVLGKLYRAIDEHKFFQAIQAQSLRSAAPNLSLADAIWKYVEKKTMLIQWKHHLEFAADVRENYEETLVETMFQYSSHPAHFISELEVFCGSILGKNGTQTRRQKESSKTMRDKHERDVAYTILCITRGDEDDGGVGALERSIACLYVACNDTARVRRKKVGILFSFTWIAAAVCLKEVERLPGNQVLLRGG
ncbi:MAG: hypothetical protein Q9163_000247 [Psora crenata]